MEQPSSPVHTSGAADGAGVTKVGAKVAKVGAEVAKVGAMVVASTRWLEASSELTEVAGFPALALTAHSNTNKDRMVCRSDESTLNLKALTTSSQKREIDFQFLVLGFERVAYLWVRI